MRNTAFFTDVIMPCFTQSVWSWTHRKTLKGQLSHLEKREDTNLWTAYNHRSRVSLQFGTGDWMQCDRRFRNPYFRRVDPSNALERHSATQLDREMM
jgi:hypothetical protein